MADKASRGIVGEITKQVRSPQNSPCDRILQIYSAYSLLAHPLEQAMERRDIPDHQIPQKAEIAMAHGASGTPPAA